MIAEEFAQYLEARGYGVRYDPITAPDGDLFLNFQRDRPNNCIIVYDETAPVLSESQALAVDQFGVQIIIRNEVGTLARDLLMAIHRDLIGFGGMPFVPGGVMVSALYIVTSPAPIGIDNKGRAEWTAHYAFRVESSGDQFRL